MLGWSKFSSSLLLDLFKLPEMFHHVVHVCVWLLSLRKLVETLHCAAVVFNLDAVW